MPKLARQVVLSLSMVVLPLAARADLVDHGLQTLDTVSGLEWLDLSQTAGLSFNQVAAQFGAGGLFAGYRYATTAEMQNLLTQFGMPLVSNTPYPTGTWATAIARFDSLLGLNVAGAGPAYGFEAITGDTTQGYHQLYYGTANSMQTLLNANPSDLVAVGDLLVSLSAEATVGYAAGFSAPVLSSFLVRNAPVVTAVPEPDTYALMFAGLAGLGLLSRRRTKTA